MKDLRLMVKGLVAGIKTLVLAFTLLCLGLSQKGPSLPQRFEVWAKTVGGNNPKKRVFFFFVSKNGVWVFGVLGKDALFF